MQSDKSAQFDVYLRAREAILTCEYMPGALITEPQLRERFAIGRNGCRLALERLVRDGLLQAEARRGYRVASATLRDVEEIFAMRAILEPLAARSACGRIDVTTLRRLDVACRARDPQLSVSEQIVALLDANQAFHLEIARASGNARLLHQLTGLMDQTRRLVSIGYGIQGERPSLKGDHGEMIDAFAEGDRKAAERIAKRHIDAFREMTMSRLQSSLNHAGGTLPVLSIEALRGNKPDVSAVFLRTRRTVSSNEEGQGHAKR